MPLKGASVATAGSADSVPGAGAAADHRCDFCNETSGVCVDPDTQVHYSAPKSAHVSPLKPQQFYSKRPDATDASVPGKQ